jgi:hypothetical protein
VRLRENETKRATTTTKSIRREEQAMESMWKTNKNLENLIISVWTPITVDPDHFSGKNILSVVSTGTTFSSISEIQLIIK